MTLAISSQPFGGYKTCLQPLLKALHWRGDARQLQDGLPYKTPHLTVTDFLNTLLYLGYNNSRVTCTLKDIPATPCLFVTDSNAYIIHQQDSSTRSAFDAATGKDIQLDDLAINGTVYTFSPIVEEDDDAETLAKARTGLTWFNDIYSRFTGLFWQIAGVSVLIQFGTLTVPLFVMIVYDQVIGAHSIQALPLLISGVLVSLLVEGLFRLLRVHALSWFGSRINAIVSAKIFEQLLFLPPIHTERVSVSAQLARLKAFESVRDFFTGTMFLTLIELPFVIVLVIGIGLMAGSLVWVIVCVAATYMFMLLATRQAVRFNTQRAARANADKQHLIVETFSHLPTITANGMTSAWQQRYTEMSHKAANASLKSSLLTETITHLAYGISMLGGIALLVFGVQAVWAEQLSIGTLVGTMILSWRVLNPLQTACVMLPRLEQIRSSIDQVNQLMSLEPERKAYQTALVYKPFLGDVQFSSVSLRYSKDIDPVVSGLSFAAPPGTLVAIAGGNGTGKTSILKLAAGLYRPQLGTVRLDNADIRQIDPIVLRRHVTYISQAPKIFSGTILENLRLTTPGLTREQAKAALQKADAWENIQQLPAGLDTNANSGLPSGLLVRLNLARAYIQQHGIILCDELPHAILNSQTGLLFKQFLSECQGNRTVLYVTHRRDFAELADTLLYLDRDQRPMVGNPTTLLQRITL